MRLWGQFNVRRYNCAEVWILPTDNRGQEKNEVLKKLFKLLISKAGILDNRFKGVRIQSLIFRNRYTVCSVGHADMFAAGDYSETDFAECPYRPLGRDISKKHFRRKPLPDIPWHPSSLPLSCGGMC